MKPGGNESGVKATIYPGTSETGPQIVMDGSATREQVVGVVRAISRAFGPDEPKKPLSTSPEKTSKGRVFPGLGEAWDRIFRK